MDLPVFWHIQSWFLVGAISTRLLEDFPVCISIKDELAVHDFKD